MKEKACIFKACYKKKVNGFSLIELILVLALLSIILLMTFSFNLFGVKTFSKGTSLSDIQNDVRMASDFIFSEIRNSTEVTLSEPLLPNEYNKIFVDSNKIKYKPAGGSTIDKTDTIIQSTSTMSLMKSGSSYIFKFIIDAIDNNNSYSLSSEVVLSNIKSAVEQNDKLVVYYKKAISYPTITPTILPTPTPTITPTPTPTPTPIPTPITEFKAEYVDATKTQNSVKIEFSLNIISYDIPLGSDFTIIHNSPDNYFIFNSTRVPADGNYTFSVVDVNSNVYDILVHYKNHGVKWDVIQWKKN